MVKMVKERFVNVNEDIFQYGEWYCSAGGVHCAEVIAAALNELCTENKELKSEITILKGGYDEYEEIVGELKAENNMLKQRVKELENKQESLHETLNLGSN